MCGRLYRSFIAAHRAAEVEARLRGVEAESQALKAEAADTNQKRESLRMELSSLQVRMIGVVFVAPFRS